MIDLFRLSVEPRIARRCHRKQIMSERTKPEIEVIRPEVEILPANHSEPGSGVGGSCGWLSVDSHGGTRRVFVARPGPIATILLVLGAGVLLTVSFVVALGLFAILVGVTAVALAGFVIHGLIRRAFNRLR